MRSNNCVFPDDNQCSSHTVKEEVLDLLRYSRGGAVSLFFLSKTLARYDRINHEPALQYRGEQGINYLFPSSQFSDLYSWVRETEIMV